MQVTQIHTAGRRWAQEYPELGTAPVPIEPCISQEYFDLERERLFKKVWLNVGRVEELPNPGDFFVRDIAVARASILVVRSVDGQVRAFHNVCSHRGNKVCWEQSGHCHRVFSCKYHGWGYGLDGTLQVVPDESQFHELGKETNGLTPVAHGICGGFIFVNLSPQPSESLDQYLGDFKSRLEGYPFEEMSTFARYEAEIKVNWKVAVDAFLEPYHAAFVHKRSLANAIPPGNPYQHIPWMKLYRYHRSQSIEANPAGELTPAQSLCMQFGGINPKLFPDRTGKFPSFLNPGSISTWGGDVNTVFPNFFLDVLLGSLVTYHFWPVAVDRTIFEFRFYHGKPKNAAEAFAQEYSKILYRDVLLEDMGTLEYTQAGLSSGAKTHMQLQDNEIAVRHSYKVVEDFVGFYGDRK